SRARKRRKPKTISPAASASGPLPGQPRDTADPFRACVYDDFMWRSRIFWRLFGTYSSLLAVSLILLGWILIGRIESHLLDEIHRGLEVKTSLVQEIIRRESGGAWGGLAARMAENTGARVTLIAADGTVLADSAENPESMENHLDRPEVRQAN